MLSAAHDPSHGELAPCPVTSGQQRKNWGTWHAVNELRADTAAVVDSGRRGRTAREASALQVDNNEVISGALLRGFSGSKARPAFIADGSLKVTRR